MKETTARAGKLSRSSISTENGLVDLAASPNTALLGWLFA
jgi:hypothetical protein